jgi:hypothetical protein
MLGNITLCSDCDKIMVNYDLHEFCCKRTNVILGMEEKLCLNCGSKVIETLSLMPASLSTGIFSRTESIEISIDPERPSKVLDEDLLYNLVINNYKNVITTLCASKTDAIWYAGYEIDLWKALNDQPSILKLDPQKKIYLTELYKSIKLWIIDPDYWLTYGTFDSPFISLKKWENLFKKHKTQQKGNE